jgi:gliding motility-associated protein GldM
METDKKEKAVVDTLPLRSVDSKDNFDQPATTLLGSEENPKKERLSIYDLKQQIIKLRKELIAIFETKKAGVEFLPALQKEMKAKLEAILNTDDPKVSVGGAKETWEIEKVLHVPLAAVVTNLTAVQANVRNAEYEVVNALMSSVYANEVRYDKAVAKVLAEKSYVIQGDEYKADVMLVAFNSTAKPEIVIGNADTTKAEDVDPMIGPGKPLDDVVAGVGKYKAGTGSVGTQTWGGCIKVVQPNGKYKYYPFKAEYEVAPPALVVSPTQMNVFYKGVDNPVEISVPGISPSALSVSIDGGGSITPDPAGKGKGSYIVRMPSSAPSLCKINITAKIGNATKPMGFKEFRVKMIPNPIAEIANINSSGDASKSALKTYPLIVKLPGFDFKIPTIKPKSFKMVAMVKGDPKEIQGSGSVLNSEMMGVIDGAKNGSKIIFQDIKVDMPDGRKDLPLNTIVIKLKG